MNVQNFENRNGRAVPNQFIINDNKNGFNVEIFQSYSSTIAKRVTDQIDSDIVHITLDPTYWDYSVTTSKYRNQFLNETKKETQKKIDSGEYILADLNK